MNGGERERDANEREKGKRGNGKDGDGGETNHDSYRLIHDNETMIVVEGKSSWPN